MERYGRQKAESRFETFDRTDVRMAEKHSTFSYAKFVTLPIAMPKFS